MIQGLLPHSYPWLGMNVDEAMIRNFSILEVLAESAAEAIAANKGS